MDLHRRMEDAVADGVFPGGVLRVERPGAEDPVEIAVGRLDRDPDSPAVTGATVYDLASLTKVIATTSLAMRAVATGLDLDAPITAVWEGAPRAGSDSAWLDTVRLRHLLAHSSGLPDWRPYHRMMEEAGVPTGGHAARDFVLERIVAEGPMDPPGTVARYSDVGFLLLGALLEEHFRDLRDAELHGERYGDSSIPLMDLRRAYRLEIAHPFDLGFLDFVPLADGPLVGAAPTEDCSWRGRVIRGEVGDENAWALGGVAPHAGLFGTAAQVARFGVAMLEAHIGRRTDLFGQDLVQRFTTKVDEPAGSSWALGWDTPTPGTSSAGAGVGPRAFGHLGFTGTSLWIDPERGAVVVLLSNRVHPSRDNRKIRDFRPAIHDAVWSLLDATTS